MGNKKSIGLPSGPNEFLKDITQHISVDGYKRYSEDVNNPYNIIESGNITMEDVDFPVKGTDNLGNEQIMMPGNNYQFPGDSVLEVPMAQTGYEVPKRNGVRLNYDDQGKVIGESSHIMKTETDGKGNWFSFPTLFQDEDGTWDTTYEKQIQLNEKNWMPAYKEAQRRGEVIDFGTDKEAAIKFGEGSWKPKMKRGGGLLDKTMECNNCGWSWKAADGGADVSTCHKCGGSALPKAQDGRETYSREQSIARQEQLIEYANEYFGGDINKAATALETGAVKGGMKFPEDAKILKTNYNKRIDNNSTGAGSAFLDAVGSVMNTTGGLMGEAIRSLKEGEKFKADRALGMHPTERQTDVAAELGIENPLAAFLVNVGSDPSTYVGAGAIRNTFKGAV